MRGGCSARTARLIIGVDLVKDAGILNAAYDDAAGVTAQFNLNLLARINRELGADFDLAAFSPSGVLQSPSATASKCISRAAGGRGSASPDTPIEFRAGETIHTENSYKYTVESFGALARGSGWTPAAVWTDADGNFSVHALKAV